MNRINGLREIARTSLRAEKILSVPVYGVFFIPQLNFNARLAVTMQTFCIVLDVLQLGFWNRVMLLQD